jgi:eukaryotic-like serine/threonine-protein kinase
VKLTDFGIAKARGFLLDQEGEVVAGKADYMSPEQASFKITDKRSDLFSAGVVLSHLAARLQHLQRRHPDESRDRIMTLEVPDFRTTGHAASTTASTGSCTALCPVIRPTAYPNADELLYELEHYIYHSGYGPTNETLGKFIRELFDHRVVGAQLGGRQQRDPARSHRPVDRLKDAGVPCVAANARRP